MDLFSAKNIVKRYTNHLALDHIDLNVPQGSVYGLLGPNGAGKTTLLRIINQITAPDEGELFFSGRKFTAYDICNIGYLPEERGLYKKMKVGEQAIYLARLKGVSKADAVSRLKKWFIKFEIQPWWDKKVEELSKGMQQKLQFITTIIHEPKLLIFDEPFSGFDPINTSIIKNEILELKRNGATIIFSTHDMGSVEQLCDNITLINESRAILEGPVHEIKMTYRSNTWEFEFETEPAGVKEKIARMGKIIDQFTSNSTYFLKIKAGNNHSGKDLLRNLVEETEIRSFKEVIPTMNDIFIQVVKSEDKNKTSGNG